MDIWEDLDTPIYNQLKRERETTPIFDQLAAEHEFKQYDRLLKPYRSTSVSWDDFFPEIAAQETSEVREEWVKSVLASAKAQPFLAVRKELDRQIKEKLMEKWQRMVNEFREAMDLPVSEFPRTLSPEEANLHIQMIRDEFEKEFVPAFLEQDLVEMYDAGIDVIVYVLGAMSNAGFDVDPGMVEVMRSNMSKMDPVTKKAIKAGPNDPSGEPEGKVLKGEAYSPPNLHNIINDQFRFGPEDDTVYRASHIPLTLGEGGPTIGEASVVMDHNGNMKIDALVEDTDVLPQINSFSISDISVPEEVIDAEEVVEDDLDVEYNVLRHGPVEEPKVEDNYRTKPQEDVVDLENFDINSNHVELLTERNYESGVEGGVHIFPSKEEPNDAVDFSGWEDR